MPQFDAPDRLYCRKDDPQPGSTARVPPNTQTCRTPVLIDTVAGVCYISKSYRGAVCNSLPARSIPDRGLRRIGYRPCAGRSITLRADNCRVSTGPSTTERHRRRAVEIGPIYHISTTTHTRATDWPRDRNKHRGSACTMPPRLRRPAAWRRHTKRYPGGSRKAPAKPAGRTRCIHTKRYTDGYTHRIEIETQSQELKT